MDTKRYTEERRKITYTFKLLNFSLDYKFFINNLWMKHGP